MTADELHERHIKDLGDKLNAAYARYEATSCFADKGTAEGIKCRMEAAIGARSSAQVARMEAERGLAA